MPAADIQICITASTLIYTGGGFLAGLVASIRSGGASGLISVYDNTSAAGTPILELAIIAGLAPFVLFFNDRFAPRFNTGCYVAITGDVSLNLWAAAR